MTELWVWLTLRKGLGARGQRRLLQLFGSPDALYRADPEALARAGLPPMGIRTLSDRALTPARTVLARCERTGVRVVTAADPDYPARLRLNEDAPAVLYCKGTLPGEDRPVIGLVGARNADADGMALARRLGSEIAACGGRVITGMARGIDAQSAAGALAGGGSVVGVLGCGPDVVYPRENADLFEQVAACGCLISEYPPGTPPNARHFPIRNRLISALSDGVVVVRAAEQSGSLITARWAAEQGRDVFAVPGDPAAPLSRGCNALLRDGAFAAECGWDVMRRYAFAYPAAVRNAAGGLLRETADTSDRKPAPRREPAKPVRPPMPEGLSPVQQQLVAALQDGALQLDALIDRTGLPAAQVLQQLTMLQIKKLILQEPGKIFRLSADGAIRTPELCGDAQA